MAMTNKQREKEFVENIRLDTAEGVWVGPAQVSYLLAQLDVARAEMDLRTNDSHAWQMVALRYEQQRDALLAAVKAEMDRHYERGARACACQDLWPCPRRTALGAAYKAGGGE